MIATLLAGLMLVTQEAGAEVSPPGRHPALALLAADGKPGPARLEDGRYALSGADGTPACGDDGEHFDLHALGAPPHAQSPNVGNFRFRIGGEAGGYILHNPPNLDDQDEDGRRRTTITGGRVHTVGVEIDGVLDSQTIGRFSARLAVDEHDQVWIEAMSFDPGRFGDREVVHVSGEAGPFIPCAPDY